ncbi:MAG: A/G-specific adenine glycosylase, partial [Ghiorsea sp.]|nr:A/G-specific adenine glycosylase [Ghiorsea sp.]
MKATVQNLLDWYHVSARDLPWRHTTNPYHIWISEIMLQQTQVKTVLPRYTTWFEVFPDIPSLAAAHADDVFKQWEG